MGVYALTDEQAAALCYAAKEARFLLKRALLEDERTLALGHVDGDEVREIRMRIKWNANMVRTLNAATEELI